MNYFELFSGFSLLFLLMLCSALISGSEVAFFSLSPQDMLDLKEEQSKRSKRIIKLKRTPRSLLATILISNNFVNIGIVILSAFLLDQCFPMELFEAWGNWIIELLHISVFSSSSIATGINFFFTVVFVTFLLVLFGEVTPKLYANIHNLQFARIVSLPLSVLHKLFGPLSSMLASWSVRMEKKNTLSSNVMHKAEFGRAIEIAVSKEDSPVEELDILKGIIKFNDITVKQIMKSRVDVTALDISSGFREIFTILKDSGYSRFPVFKEDFDNIEGLLYVKDLLGHNDENDDFPWQEKIRKNLLYVPETKKINDLLKEFQLKRMHMAIVVDEYGGSAGIVTLEDIMEEVLGDIKDEFDDEEEMDYLKIDEHNYIFEGKTLLNDVCRIMGLDTESFDNFRGEADSLAGLVLEILGFIPKADKEVDLENFRFKIISANNRRIEKINVQIKVDLNQEN